MNKICIVGCGGSGKSTFARKLGELTGLPVLYLDVYFWKAGWVQRNREEWESIVHDLVKKDRWIMDGNFEKTQDIRFENADTIIFLDIPLYKCLINVLKRLIIYRNNKRLDMADGCKESFDFSFYKWIWRFKKTDGKKTMVRLKQLNGQKEIVILRNNKEIDKYLDKIKKNYC
jgi:adenylate kinase family enzyme